MKTEKSKKLTNKWCGIHVYGILVGGWVGNNSWTHPPFCSRHLVPQNVGNILCVCYFLNIGSESKKTMFSALLQEINSELFYLEPHRKVTATTLELFTTNFKNLKNKTTNQISNLDFFVKSGFPKTRDLSPAAPRGVYISRNDPPKKIDNWPGSLGRAEYSANSTYSTYSK